MYGETFYGRHTAQHQMQRRQIKIKKKSFFKPKIAKECNSQNFTEFALNNSGNPQLIFSVYTKEQDLQSFLRYPAHKVKRPKTANLNNSIEQ